MIMRDKWDVGVVGYWYATNYGSVLTYYALGKAIENMGKSSVLIDRPEKERDPEGEDVISRNFLRTHIDISPSVSWDNYDSINDMCDNFVIGSDQVWTYDAIKHMKYMFFLSFASEDKRKIAYSPSFGTNKFDVPANVRRDVENMLANFDAVSIREDAGKKLLHEQFGIDAQQNVDPVFLLPVEEYNKIGDESSLDTSKDYILAYILDPTPDKEEALKKLEAKYNMPVKIVLDGRKGTFDRNLAKFTIYGEQDILKDVTVEDWVKLFRDSAYVYTDSHHGLAMAIIFNKQFVCYANHGRGYVRFTSLLGMLDMMPRLIENNGGLTEELMNTDIDFNYVNGLLNSRINYSKAWLYDALWGKRKKVARLPKPFDRDFERCRMVVSMMKQYGIKHIVLSSGTRNLNLVRLFEGNSYFKTYNVIDERSAGFYALGLALQLQETVAICCTSGTAASNYLTAVTEAFYQRVPLVVVTADRYPCYLGQMDDQTIPQSVIYDGVIKKSVSLPVNEGYMADWETRRMISEALLEVNHHGSGPVQINVPVQTIHRETPSPEKLFLWNYKMINRYELGDDKARWNERVERLMKSKRVLVVYGQAPIPNEEQQAKLTRFFEKFNATVLIDHLSNYRTDKTILSFPILKGMSQQEFNEKLSPDIVITIGGKRMLNDPIVFKLRGMGKDYEHWRIAPDGEICDMFRRLTSVFECTTDYFVDYFLDYFDKNARDWSSDNEYYDLWKQYSDKVKDADHFEYYNMKYTMENFMKNIPDNSLLHIAIGNTVMFSNIYPLKKNVEVFCNMGTNGIDGCASTYMGHVAATDKPAYLIIGDLSFFYDMNSVFNKELKPNIRILMSNNDGAGLLRDLNSPAITHEHHTVARDYVTALGFRYISAKNKEEYDEMVKLFTSEEVKEPIFFEVFT